tara:strand:+ start:7030 stop:8379 length:1350 start_codon:yes stop_codon:yes gene_type:complete
MSGYVKTMRDLESSSYGLTGGAAGNAVLKSAGLVGGFGTAHDGGTSIATGATGLADLYNVLYGQKVWSMLNQEVNALSMVAKRPYTSSGWRVLKSRPQGGSGSSFSVTSGGAAGSTSPDPAIIGGVIENASLGSTGFEALAPEYDKLFVSPKTVAHLFEFSELGMELAAIDDGVGDIRAIVREDMGKHHAESQNKMLLMPFELYGADTNDDATPTDDLSKNYTSLLKIVSSEAEVEAMAAAGLIGSSDDTIENAAAAMRQIYGKARGATGNGYLDAVINFGGGYAAGDARLLTLSLLNSVIREVRENGGNTKVMLTGYDTVQAIGDLLQAQERFMDRREIVPTHNGVRGVKGAEVGFRVATYYDIPIIPCKDMPKTGQGSGKLSDILLLDTDHLWLSVMKPTQYFEDGITNGNPFGVGKLGNQGMYRTIGETCCSFFKGQAKITNLKSA